MWFVRDRRQTEQVAGCPAERLGLVAPLGNETAAVIAGLLPGVRGDVVRAAGFESLKSTTKTIKTIKGGALVVYVVYVVAPRSLGALENVQVFTRDVPPSWQTRFLPAAHQYP
jgi:hypothetical protein